MSEYSRSTIEYLVKQIATEAAVEVADNNNHEFCTATEAGEVARAEAKRILGDDDEGFC